MLRIIKVGSNDASDRYVRNKMKAVEKAGMECELIALEDTTTEYLEQLLFETALDKNVSAVIVQLPLPKHIDKRRVMAAIAPSQDIDGLNPRSLYKPLTPCAIMRWISSQGIPLEGRTVTILGRSELVGKPLANMMIDAGATVTVCNSHTPLYDLVRLCQMADIIVSAVGKVYTLQSGMVRCTKGQTVIDVGINKDPGTGRLCGDVSRLARQVIQSHGGFCTPVPGGVGKWTVEELVMRLKEMESQGE